MPEAIQLTSFYVIAIIANVVIAARDHDVWVLLHFYKGMGKDFYNNS